MLVIRHCQCQPLRLILPDGCLYGDEIFRLVLQIRDQTGHVRRRAWPGDRHTLVIERLKHLHKSRILTHRVLSSPVDEKLYLTTKSSFAL